MAKKTPTRAATARKEDRRPYYYESRDPSPAWRRETTKHLGFDPGAAQERLCALLATEPETTARGHALRQVLRWQTTLVRMDAPENMAAARWASEVKNMQTAAKRFTEAVRLRLQEEAYHASHFASRAPHMDRRIAVLKRAGGLSTAMARTLRIARRAIPRYVDAALPDPDPTAGAPRRRVLAIYELALYEGGFSIDEVEDLLSHGLADRKRVTAAVREAVRGQIRQRIARERRKRDAQRAAEEAAWAEFIADPEARAALDRARERLNPRFRRRDKTRPGDSVA